MENNYKTQLEILLSGKKISQSQYEHFMRRGAQRILFDKSDALCDYFPNGIVVGASKAYIQQMKIPYQETSYMVARLKSHPAKYIFKTEGKGGGVVKLSGGVRPLGDNIFASLNRIILGGKAIIVSATNFVENKEQVWNWQFFAKNLKDSHPGIYENLSRLAYKNRQNPLLVVVARKKHTFDRLGILDLYRKGKIRVLDEQLQKVVFLTNDAGYDYASKHMQESDHVRFISKTSPDGRINLIGCLRDLRKRFGIKVMLNDGGREMSNGMKALGVLGGERVTYEPYPGKKNLPRKIAPDSVFGMDGAGLDGGEVKDSFTIFSHEIKTSRTERVKVHVYSLNEKVTS